MNYTLVAEMIDDKVYTIGRYDNKSKALSAFDSMKAVLLTQVSPTDIYKVLLQTEKGLVIKKCYVYDHKEEEILNKGETK